MSAEADAVCGAPYGMPGPDRVNVRNGYRHRDFDIRAGTLDVAIPKLRSGSYFPDWLLERWQVTDCVVTMNECSYYIGDRPTKRVLPTPRTTAADFRMLTPLVLMEALRQAGTVVCQPMARVRLGAPRSEDGRRAVCPGPAQCGHADAAARC